MDWCSPHANCAVSLSYSNRLRCSTQIGRTRSLDRLGPGLAQVGHEVTQHGAAPLANVLGLVRPLIDLDDWLVSKDEPAEWTKEHPRGHCSSSFCRLVR